MNAAPDARRTVAGAVVIVALVAVTVTLALPTGGGPAAGDLRGPSPAVGDRAPVDSDDLSLPDDVGRLHERGITGDGTTVGVVDVTGFDVDNPSLRGRVDDARAFGDASTVANAGINHHGTAAAVMVAETAPDARLVLAKADSPSTVRQSIRWLVRQDVDVVVLQFSVAGVADDGGSAVSRTVSQARDDGVVVVAPTGNRANGHWEGPLRPTTDGRHRFSDGTENRLESLRPGQDLTAGPTELRLTWNDSTEEPVDLDLAVYRRNPTGSDEVVARSERVRRGTVHVERLRTTLEAGTHYVVVRHSQAPSVLAAAGPVTLELSSSTHGLDQTKANGSITAPATARKVLSVGAYNRSADAVASYSGRGPTADGRRGVDVVSPVGVWDDWPRMERPGTSTGAAYAGGTVALLLEVDPSLSPAATEQLVKRGAAVHGDGPDINSGHGVIDPVATVQLASGEDPFRESANESEPDGGT